MSITVQKWSGKNPLFPTSDRFFGASLITSPLVFFFFYQSSFWFSICLEISLLLISIWCLEDSFLHTFCVCVCVYTFFLPNNALLNLMVPYASDTRLGMSRLSGDLNFVFFCFIFTSSIKAQLQKCCNSYIVLMVNWAAASVIISLLSLFFLWDGAGD